MRLRFSGLVLAVLCCAALVRAQSPISPGATVSEQPFTPSLFTQLALTPQQSVTASHIANAVSQSLLVRVYDISEFDEYTLDNPIILPASQLIAIRQQQIQQELASRNPDPVLIANLSSEIASLQQTREVVISTAYTTLYAMLTPEQRANMPQLATLLQSIG